MVVSKKIISDYTVDIIGLTKYEAEVLFEVLQHVGGQTKGPRGVVQKIHDALAEQGVERPYGVGSSGSVYLTP